MGCYEISGAKKPREISRHFSTCFSGKRAHKGGCNRMAWNKAGFAQGKRANATSRKSKSRTSEPGSHEKLVIQYQKRLSPPVTSCGDKVRAAWRGWEKETGANTRSIMHWPLSDCRRNCKSRGVCKNVVVRNMGCYPKIGGYRPVWTTMSFWTPLMPGTLAAIWRARSFSCSVST